MSSPNPKEVLIAYRAWLAEHPGGHAEMSRLLHDQPSDEALRNFEQEDTKHPRFLGRLLRAIQGHPDVPGLAEEAETALRLMREAQATMLRVAERLRHLPPDFDIRSSVIAADDVSLLEQPDLQIEAGTVDVSASVRRRRKGR